PLPNFSGASERELKNALQSKSFRVRLETSRALVRRNFVHSPRDLLAQRSGEFAVRAAGEPDHVATVEEQQIIEHGLRDSNERVRLQAVIAAGFQNMTNSTEQIAQLITDSNRVIAHTAVEALKRLGTADVCWPILDSSDGGKRAAALRVLQGIHLADVVDGLATRLQS